MLELLHGLFDFILHVDQHLDTMIHAYGIWTYLILCLIVFCETGLVVAPLLPGDSLLFAAGALASRGGLNVHFLVLFVILSAIFGDMVNYWIGKFLGLKFFNSRSGRSLIKKEHLERTQDFYEKYGPKTIVLARFVPIVRTFAPFVAGIGTMKYLKFLSYNIIGGILWVLGFVYGGYFFGELPIVRKSFTLVMMGIVVLSFLPILWQLVLTKKKKQNGFHS